jgi:hypothetical protein
MKNKNKMAGEHQFHKSCDLRLYWLTDSDREIYLFSLSVKKNEAGQAHIYKKTKLAWRVRCAYELLPIELDEIEEVHSFRLGQPVLENALCA